MFDLDMLVEGSFRAIRFLAGLDRAPIVSFYLTGGPSESFLAVVLALDSSFDFITFFFQFVETPRKFVPLVKQLSELAEEDSVGEEQSAVLMVVLEIGVFVD